MNALEKAKVNILREDKIFYASLLMQMYIQEVNSKQVPTLGVTINNGRLFLYWNPDFFNKLSSDEQKAVLEHECLHLVYFHPGRGSGRDHQLWNLAIDMVVNQMIQNLPADHINIDTFPELNLPTKANAEHYYEIMKKRMSKYKIEMQGCGTGNSGKDGGGDGEGPSIKITRPDGSSITIKPVDSHDKWNDEDSTSKGGISELDRQVIRQAIQDAYETSKDQGHLPGEVLQQIKDLLKPPTIPWNEQLKKYVGNSVRAGTKSTWKRLSRRIPLEEFKGKARTRKIKLVVVTDTSGSVSEAEYQDFIGELRGIQKVYRTQFTMIECDAQVQKVYQLPASGPIEVDFKGRGGTAFEPAFDYVLKHRLNPTVLIYMTDLYGSFPEKPPFNTIWVQSEDSTYPHKDVPFGIILKINRKEIARQRRR